MPYKLRNDRRHKFEKVKFKITNWSEYNQALKERGSITLWLSPEIIKAWHPKKSKQKLQGGQFKYSDTAIQAALSIKTVYHLPYRATQGLLESIMSLMRIKLDVPDYTSICRRAAKLELPELVNIGNEDHINIVIDSTGLKIFGAGIWSEEKHGLKKRRQWRKLHLTIDRDSHSIIAQELTDSDVTDDSQVTLMLDNVVQNITHFAADTAYDTNAVYDSIVARAGDATIAIPPRPHAALFSVNYNDDPTKRDHNILFAEKHGKYCWQDYSDYNYRALAETAMFRYKAIISEKLFSRKMAAQKVEARIACVVLNKMTALGMPKSTKIKVAA
jgi:hypothetical protein